jgi:hypothetical protein
MIIDPASTVAKLTPFWSSREIGTYAVDHTTSDYLQRGLGHGVATTVVLLGLVATISTIRLRQRSPRPSWAGGSRTRATSSSA